MNSKTYTTLRKICEKYPKEVCKIMLETPFPLPELIPNTGYMRQSDDTCAQLTVGVLHDGDSGIEVIEVTSDLNPDDLVTRHRFRNSIGGGQSPRVHLALRMLALAIKLDNEEKAQPLLPFARL